MLLKAFHQHLERFIYFSGDHRYQYQVEIQKKPLYFIEPPERQEKTLIKVNIYDNKEHCFRQFEYHSDYFRKSQMLSKAQQYFDVNGLIPNLKSFL